MMQITCMRVEKVIEISNRLLDAIHCRRLSAQSTSEDLPGVSRRRFFGETHSAGRSASHYAASF